MLRDTLTIIVVIIVTLVACFLLIPQIRKRLMNMVDRIREILEDVRASRRAGVCYVCDKPLDDNRSDITRIDYWLSALCTSCQDKVLGEEA